MKKSIIMGMLLIIGTVCFAQNTQKIDGLIKSDLNKNFSLIQEEAANFGDAELLAIYNNHKKSVQIGALGGVINLLPPFLLLPNFGIGNFIQKDQLGGVITLSGTVLGSGMMLLGVLNMEGVADAIPFSSGTSAGNNSNKMWPAVVMISGGVIFYASSIFGVVRAFIFPSSYNKKLNAALNINHVTVSIAPSVSNSENGLSLVVSMKW